MDSKSVDVYSTVLPFELHGPAAIVNLHKICVCTTSNIRFYIIYSLQHTHYHIIYCELLVPTYQLLVVALYIPAGSFVAIHQDDHADRHAMLAATPYWPLSHAGHHVILAASLCWHPRHPGHLALLVTMPFWLHHNAER